MGNDIATLNAFGEASALSKKIDDPEFKARVEKEFQPDGSYYRYRVAKIEAEIDCSDPRIHFSETRRKACINAKLKVFGLKIEAHTKTDGIAAVFDTFLKE